MPAAILLAQILPKVGFAFSNSSNITSRKSHDQEIQKAIRGSGARWCRPVVTEMLVAVFETATVTLQAVCVPRSGDVVGAVTAVYEALDITHRATAWAAAALEPSIFQELVLGIRAARRVSLRTLRRDEAGGAGSCAGRLAAAVDAFDEVLGKRGWSGANELRALEGNYTDGDEDRIRRARSNKVAPREEEVPDSLEGAGFGGTVAEADYEVEIITEGEGRAPVDGDVKIWSLGGEVGDCSMEPYLGRDSCF